MYRRGFSPRGFRRRPFLRPRFRRSPMYRPRPIFRPWFRPWYPRRWGCFFPVLSLVLLGVMLALFAGCAGW